MSTADTLLERIKDMKIAHRMSHEPFCDSSYWQDEFEKEAEAALGAYREAVGGKSE